MSKYEDATTKDIHEYQVAYQNIQDYMGELYTVIDALQGNLDAIERYVEFHLEPECIANYNEVAEALDGILTEMERAEWWVAGGMKTTARLRRMRGCKDSVEKVQGYFEEQYTKGLEEWLALG